MLYWIAKLLATHHTGFHVFSYLTLRGILAVMSALSMALLVGPSMIARLSRYQIGQVVRDDGPRSHLPKAGTPTMGGALIIVAIVLSTLLWSDLRNRFVWITLGVEPARIDVLTKLTGLDFADAWTRKIEEREGYGLSRAWDAWKRKAMAK